MQRNQEKPQDSPLFVETRTVYVLNPRQTLWFWTFCPPYFLPPLIYFPFFLLYPFRPSVSLGDGTSQWYSAGLRVAWSGVRVPAGAGYFSLHRYVQPGSGAHPASYPMGTRGSLPGGKAATHLHLVLRSRNACSYTSTPQYAFMAWCLV
jgi:hypothetical protein